MSEQAEVMQAFIKALGFHFQPKWASRPQVWTYRTRGSRIITRRYRPTPASRSRIARLSKNPTIQAEVSQKHATLFLKTEITAIKDVYRGK